MALHFGGRAFGDLAAEIDGDDTIRHRHDKAHVMFHQQNSHVLQIAYADNLLLQDIDFGMVETGRRLVEQQ